MAKTEISMEDNVEKLIGRTVIEAMKKSGRARDAIRKFSQYDFSSAIKAPETDLIDLQDEIVVLINVPGVKKKDIELNVSEESISLKAIAAAEQGTYIRCERPYEFKLDLILPVEIKPEEVRAQLNDGVLKIHLPKLIVTIAQKVTIE